MNSFCNIVYLIAAFFVFSSALLYSFEDNPNSNNDLQQNQTTDCFAQLLSQRFSGRTYDSTKLVTQDQLKAIMEAARLAPSSYNDQPWNFIICNRSTHPEAYKMVLSVLVEFNQQWAENAPVLIITVAASKNDRGEFNRWGQYDSGAAAFSMMLQATSLGLMAHQMGGFDAAKIQKLFSIPEFYVPMSVMAIGYPSASQEKPVRSRKPLEDNFFMGKWGKRAQ